jgi:hypothetical protein
MASCANEQVAQMMTPEGITPEAPRHLPDTPGQDTDTGGIIPPPTPAPATELTVPTTGRRPALGNLRRELLEAELAHPGVQKLLLDRLDVAESENSSISLFSRTHKCCISRRVPNGRDNSAISPCSPRICLLFTNLSTPSRRQLDFISGSGKQSSGPRPDGGTNHLFFCGLPKTIWHDQRPVQLF